MKICFGFKEQVLDLVSIWWMGKFVVGREGEVIDDGGESEVVEELSVVGGEMVSIVVEVGMWVEISWEGGLWDGIVEISIRVRQFII